MADFITRSGMDMDESQLGTSGAGFQDAYFSAFKAQSVSQQRVNSAESTDSNGNIIPFDFTFIDDVIVNSNGTADDAQSGQHYVFSSNGKYRVEHQNSARFWESAPRCSRPSAGAAWRSIPPAW